MTGPLQTIPIPLITGEKEKEKEREKREERKSERRVRKDRLT